MDNLILSIAALCQFSIGVTGDFGGTVKSLDQQVACHKYYVNCYNKNYKPKQTDREVLFKCILEEK